MRDYRGITKRFLIRILLIFSIVILFEGVIIPDNVEVRLLEKAPQIVNSNYGKAVSTSEDLVITGGRG